MYQLTVSFSSDDSGSTIKRMYCLIVQDNSSAKCSNGDATLPEGAVAGGEGDVVKCYQTIEECNANTSPTHKFANGALICAERDTGKCIPVTTGVDGNYDLCANITDASWPCKRNADGNAFDCDESTDARQKCSAYVQGSGAPGYLPAHVVPSPPKPHQSPSPHRPHPHDSHHHKPHHSHHHKPHHAPGHGTPLGKKTVSGSPVDDDGRSSSKPSDNAGRSVGNVVVSFAKPDEVP